MSDKERDLTVEPGGDDRLARQLRSAGPRPGVPAATAARLRLAMQAAIDRESARRRRTRRVRWLAAAALLATLVLAVRFVPWSTDADLGPIARVVGVTGTAFGPFAAGSPIGVDEWLETGPGMTLAIQAETGHSIRLAPGSRARFTAARRVELTAGAVYVDSGVDSAAVTIDTALGRIEELGTRYMVQVADSTLAVRVREGRIALHRDADRHEAAAGVELAVDAAGSVSRTEIPIYGPAWQWALEAASAPEIDGQPLRVLLDWVVHETGWRLEFGDPQTAERAPEIEVRGSMEGLSPVEALDTILPTCGLTHTVRSGTLIVRVPSQD